MPALSLPRLVICAASALFLLALGAPAVHAQPAPGPATAPAACPPLLQHTMDRLQDEQPQSLCQYAGLEALYAKHKDRGLVVLGFPSNDFAQERGSNQDIAAFCENTFGVKFPMFTKTSVVGKQAHPFYKQLAAQAGGPPRWNFYKYVVGRDGQVAASFGSMTTPQDPRFLRQVEQLLAK